MNRCMTCKTTQVSLMDTCETCGHSIDSPSAALVKKHVGFKAEAFAGLAGIEAKNFWFRARNRLIILALKNYCPALSSFLEIGCGTGFVLSGISKAFPHAFMHGTELFKEGLDFAASRLPSANLIQMDARQLPYVDEYDAIGAFDVLEHIEEDQQVLRKIYSALKPGGKLFITVPQHAWLWSPVDEYACHVRRYSANEIHLKMKEAGFEILQSTSFVTTLLPVLFISRFIQKFKKTYDPSTEAEIHPWLNFFFEKLLNAEIFMIKKGVRFPVGGTRFIVAQK